MLSYCVLSLSLSPYPSSPSLSLPFTLPLPSCPPPPFFSLPTLPSLRPTLPPFLPASLPPSTTHRQPFPNTNSWLCVCLSAPPSRREHPSIIKGDGKAVTGSRSRIQPRARKNYARGIVETVMAFGSREKQMGVESLMMDGA